MPAGSYVQLLRRKGLPEVLLAASLSRLASRMVTLAIILFALDRFKSPALVGWVAFASLAPGLAVSPLAGALLDRIGATRAIAVDMVASAVVLFGFVMTSLGGAMSVPIMLAFVTLFSLTSPLGAAAIRVLIPGLVPVDELDRANALDAGSYAVVDVIGPAVAGALIGFAGAHACFLVIATLYALAAIALLPAQEAIPEVEFSADAAIAAGSGSRRAACPSTSVPARACRCLSLYQFGMGVLIVVVPVAIARHFGPGSLSETMTGTLFALAGLAGGAGALAAGWFDTGKRERDVIAGGALLTAFAIFPLGAAFGIAGLVCAVLLVGFCAGPVDVGLLSMRQRRTEPGWLGRVLAVSMSLNLSGLPLGSALGGMLIAYSVPIALSAAALASLLAAVAVYALVPAENV